MKKANISQNRFLKLAKLNQDIFSIDDLSRIWGIKNRHNLYITLGRYVKNGSLINIHRGLYSLKEVHKLDPKFLGSKALNRYCYLSAESVLFSSGVIFQEVSHYTFISPVSRRFSIDKNSYYTRKLKDEFLYNSVGIVRKGNIYVATLERAVADILHYNPNYHFDNFKLVNVKKLREIQKSLGYKIN